MAVKKPTLYSKAEFCKKLAEKQSITQKAATENLEAFLETLSEILAAGDAVRFMGFGTFEVSKKAARKGINPATGETIKIAARKAVSFKVGVQLKEIVNAKKSKK